MCGCDWTFFPRVNPLQTTQTNMVSNWPVCIHRVSKRLSVLLLSDWAEKSKSLLAPIRSQSYSVWNWSAKTPGALSFVLDLSSPEIFLARLDFVPPLLTAPRSVSRPFRNEWLSKGEFESSKVNCKTVVFFCEHERRGRYSKERSGASVETARKAVERRLTHGVWITLTALRAFRIGKKNRLFCSLPIKLK